MGFDVSLTPVGYDASRLHDKKYLCNLTLTVTLTSFVYLPEAVVHGRHLRKLSRFHSHAVAQWHLHIDHLQLLRQSLLESNGNSALLNRIESRYDRSLLTRRTKKENYTLRLDKTNLYVVYHTRHWRDESSSQSPMLMVIKTKVFDLSVEFGHTIAHIVEPFPTYLYQIPVP